MPNNDSAIRPVGLGSTVWNILNGKAPAAAPETPAPTLPAAQDSFSATSVFRNGRFAAYPELAKVAAGQQILKPGMQTSALTSIQHALNDMGFSVAMPTPGYYDAQTVQAIKNFQVMAGLESDGTIGPKTMAALDQYAPAPDKKAWDAGQNLGPLPSPKLPGGKIARVVVSISQHRAFLFDKKGNLTKIYGVRTGRDGHADGRGSATSPGIRQIDSKNADPTAISKQLWPESGGRAFGDRLIGLTLTDPITGKRLPGNNGQELHGTDQAGSIGRDFSHGCVGLVNGDIKELFGTLKVGEFVRFDA